MYSDYNCDAELNQSVIERLKRSWNNRVAVRNERLDLTEYCEPAIPDFPMRMVPFRDDKEFISVDARTRLRLLAGAWIMYNEKTIYIEDELINPACQLLLRGDLPGVSDPEVKEVIAQTIVDEQFHILMCLEVCNSARQRHALQDMVLSQPLLITRARESLAGAGTKSEIALAKLAYALVAEMTINTYLKELSSDLSIQPLNRINTDMHRQDEAAHSAIFRQLGISVYKGLDSQQAHVFKEYICRALADFTEPDNTGWVDILTHLNIPRRSDIIVRMNERTKGKRLTRDFSAFKELIDELGLAEEISLFSA